MVCQGETGHTETLEMAAISNIGPTKEQDQGCGKYTWEIHADKDRIGTVSGRDMAIPRMAGGGENKVKKNWEEGRYNRVRGDGGLPPLGVFRVCAHPPPSRRYRITRSVYGGLTLRIRSFLARVRGPGKAFTRSSALS